MTDWRTCFSQWRRPEIEGLINAALIQIHLYHAIGNDPGHREIVGDDAGARFHLRDLRNQPGVQLGQQVSEDHVGVRKIDGEEVAQLDADEVADGALLHGTPRF